MTEDVNIEPQSQVQPEPQEETPVVVEPAAVQPGEKTPSHLLLESLHEERDRRREAEAKAAELEQIIRQAEAQDIQTTVPSDDYFDPVNERLSALQSQIAKLEDERELEKVYAEFPDLKEVAADFDTFRKDYPRHKLSNVAKLFRVEKGLTQETRQGLEDPTGGDRQPISTGMTADEVADLRKNNFRKYQEMLMQGKINLD